MRDIPCVSTSISGKQKQQKKENVNHDDNINSCNVSSFESNNMDQLEEK